MPLKVHHLNCGTMCPIGGVLSSGNLFSPTRFVCHCLLIETNQGLVLVDTGIGQSAIENPDHYLGFIFMQTIRPKLEIQETALSQIKKLGFQPKDVQHIILTHLDPDHAGGITDFPWAKVHVFEKELQAARNPRSIMEFQRYMKPLWEHNPKWATHNLSEGENWNGFSCVKNLKGLPEEILMIPLHGHTHGHCGIAVESQTGNILHAGDAYFYYKELYENRDCPLAIEFLQTLMEVDRNLRLENQKKLRELVRIYPVTKVSCSHDQYEFMQLAGKEK